MNNQRNKKNLNFSIKIFKNIMIKITNYNIIVKLKLIKMKIWTNPKILVIIIFIN